MLASFMRSEAQNAVIAWLTQRNVLSEEFPTYFIATAYDHPLWPVLRPDGQVTLMSWGLIPHWSGSIEDARQRQNQLINARSETMFEKPSFRASARAGRAVMITSGFFEFHKHDGKSYPFYIYPADGRPLFLGALWSHWTEPSTADAIDTFSVVTTAANRLMEIVHNVKKRMPVVLEESQIDSWIDPAADVTDIHKLSASRDIPWLRAHPVDRRANSNQRAANVPDIQLPFAYSELDAVVESIHELEG